MKRCALLSFIILFFFLWAGFTSAGPVEPKLYYQKQLTKVLTTGLHQFTFSLWNAETGGESPWSETKPISVTATTRIVSTYLGDTASLDPLLFSMQLWVQMEVDGQVMGARDKLVMAPYAMWSSMSDTPGPEGSIGPAGPAGPMGPTGTQGLIGPQGIQGAVGPVGPQGLKGDTGATGSAGPQGPQGSIGLIGPVGPQGPPGTAILPNCPAGHVLMSMGSSEWSCRLLCSGVLVDIQTDVKNCGACGNQCFGGVACNAGICGEIPPCASGLTLCGFICTDLQADKYNCGLCGSVCPSNQACRNGVCVSQLPSAPQNVTASAGDSYIDIYWNIPASDGGYPILFYKAYRDGDYIGYTIDPSIHDDHLTNGVIYSYRISAVNANVEGPKSEEVIQTPHLPASLPLPPAAQGFIVTSGASTCHLVWSAPDGTGGSSILWYYIYREGVKIGQIKYNESRSYDDNMVTNGQSYAYQVSVVNGVGEGQKSDAKWGYPNE
jgi:hypothetical protein